MSRVVVNEIEAKVGNDITFNDTVKIDTIKGKTTAGSVTVQGEGTATTNLQQGLAKAWVNLNASSFGLRDSFNVASVTDNGTGDHTITISNDFGNANYSAVGCCIAGTGSENNGQVVSSIGSSGHAPAGSLRFAVQYSSTQVKNDVSGISIQFHGDLA